jgi:aspartokinase
MLTIPNVVEEVIKKKPFLEGALIEGLINLSALARHLKSEIEQKIGKPVNESAVIMALNRLVPRLVLTSDLRFKRVIEGVGDIIVRSNLTDFTYSNTSTLYGRQKELLKEVYSSVTAQDVLCTISQGIYETTFVVSSSLNGIVEKIFQDENLVVKRSDLSSITVKLPHENTSCPGVYYYIFKELAWDNINVVEVISTSHEFTVVVGDADIHRAFTILMDAKRGMQQ